MQLTDYSPHMCQELGLSGFITYLTRFVKCLGGNTLLSKVRTTKSTHISIIKSELLFTLGIMYSLYHTCMLLLFNVFILRITINLQFIQ